MNAARIKYWHDTIRMCEDAMRPRARYWSDLKLRLGLKFNVAGVPHPIYISRFYKIVREIVASVMFRHPYIYITAEGDPVDEESGDVLQDASPILQDFANDAMEIMACKKTVQQVGFDGLFCFRGWAKFGFMPAGGGAPYIASDDIYEDFTCLSWKRPDQILVDPLVEPHNLYSARFVIDKMFPSLDDVIEDSRFKKFKIQIQGLKGKTAGPDALPFSPDDEQDKDDEERKTLLEAHRLANTRRMYEIHDRVHQQRFIFIDDIKEPIEEIGHPFLADVVDTISDPLTGATLLSVRDEVLGAEGVHPRKKWLIEGGLPFLTLSFDVSDDFYGTPIMAYENPIQNAIIKIVSRQMDLLERFKRRPKIAKREVDENPNIVTNVREGVDGEPIVLLGLENLQGDMEWGKPPEGAVQLQQDLLAFEAQTIRTTMSGTNPETATETAVAASEAEINRTYMQGAVEEFYIRIVKNTFSVLSDDRFSPKNHPLRLSSDEGEELQDLALKSWMLRGRWNVNIAAGSANILYEAMQKNDTLSMVQMLRGSPNIKDVELDRSIIRAYGKVDPKTLLKPEANTDAAKAAELENQMFFIGHDPGVTQGEDHKTHMALQGPALIAQHPRFLQLTPEMQQQTLRLASTHIQAHTQMQQQEARRFMQAGRGAGNGRTLGPAESLISQVSSNAQRTQDVVSKQAKERMARG